MESKMYKLVAPEGRWMLRDGSSIFSNVVWLSNMEEVNKYVLIEDNSLKKKKLDRPIENMLVACREI